MSCHFIDVFLQSQLGLSRFSFCSLKISLRCCEGFVELAQLLGLPLVDDVSCDECSSIRI